MNYAFSFQDRADNISQLWCRGPSNDLLTAVLRLFSNLLIFHFPVGFYIQLCCLGSKELMQFLLLKIAPPPLVFCLYFVLLSTYAPGTSIPSSIPGCYCVYCIPFVNLFFLNLSAYFIVCISVYHIRNHSPLDAKVYSLIFLLQVTSFAFRVFTLISMVRASRKSFLFPPT